MTITLTITPDTPPQMLRLMTTVMHMLTAQEPLPTAEPTFPHEFEFKPLPDTPLTLVDTFKDEWASKNIYTPDIDDEAEVLREMVQGERPDLPDQAETVQDQTPMTSDLTGRMRVRRSTPRVFLGISASTPAARPATRTVRGVNGAALIRRLSSRFAPNSSRP